MARGRRSAGPSMPKAEDLERAAIDYLGRFAASEADLRRVLQNRLRKAQFRQEDKSEDTKPLAAAIERIVEKHVASGILNDSKFAEMKVASLRRSGRSARAIAAKLQQKGIKPELIKASLNDGGEEFNSGDADLKAARLFAKRKRLGPFSLKEQTKETMRKELARLARAGFALSTCRQVLETKAEVEDEEAFDLGDYLG